MTQDFDRVDHLLLNKGIIDNDLIIQLESGISQTKDPENSKTNSDNIVLEVGKSEEKPPTLQ